MDSLQPVVVDVGIDLRRRDIGVAEHFLNRPQVGPPLQQMRREAVPQRVRREALADPGPQGRLPH